MTDRERDTINLVIDLVRVYEWHAVPTMRDADLTEDEQANIHARALEWLDAALTATTPAHPQTGCCPDRTATPPAD
jgi:hypothetical protein